jgi:hypothetical protein
MNIAYTIGMESSYDKALEEILFVYKLGKTDDYEGGWVWRTPDEIPNFIKNNPLPWQGAIYQLELPEIWEKCVSENPAEDGVHRLLVDAHIFKKYASLT